MNPLEIIYFGFNQIAIKDLTDLINVANAPITLLNKGTIASSITLKREAKKPATVGIFLTSTEYEELKSKINRLSPNEQEKIHVVNSYEEALKVIEDIYGQPLNTLESKSETSVVSESVKVSEEVVSESGVSVHSESERVNSGARVSTSEVAKTDEEPAEPTGRADSDNVDKPVDGEPSMGLRDLMFEELTLQLEESRQKIKDLTFSLEELRYNSQGVSNEELAKSEAELQKAKSDLEVSMQQVYNLKEQLSKAEEVKLKLEKDAEDYRNIAEQNRSLMVSKQEEIKVLQYQLDEAKTHAKVELSKISVPSNVQVYVSASALSLINGYTYLLSHSFDSLLVDISPDSYLDALVTFVQEPLRHTKWLLEGIKPRMVFNRIEKADNVSEGISVISSPSVVLKSDFLEQVDWVRCMDDLADLDRPVNLFLGTYEFNGVSEFIDRLEDQVKILRADNPIDLRAFNKVRYSHNNVVEVLI